MSRFQPFYSPGREGFTDQALAHIVQNPRVWAHWSSTIVPGLFLQFQGWVTTKQRHAPRFRVFAVGENHQRVRLSAPQDGDMVRDFKDWASQLSVPGPWGSKIQPSFYLIHPDIDSQVLCVSAEEVDRLAVDTVETMDIFKTFPFYSETMP